MFKTCGLYGMVVSNQRKMLGRPKFVPEIRGSGKIPVEFVREKYQENRQKDVWESGDELLDGDRDRQWSENDSDGVSVQGGNPHERETEGEVISEDTPPVPFGNG